MHGLINKSIEAFARETYGPAFWLEVTDRAQLGFTEFEAMLTYDEATMLRTVEAIAVGLNRPAAHVLEDLGTFLVTSPTIPAIRRLLRFGGVTYEDFLHSLEELPERVRLAVDDLWLPELTLNQKSAEEFALICHPGLPGYSHVLLGVLRSMADDYGSLAMLDHSGPKEGGDELSIIIVQDAFAEGRSFVLGAQGA